LRRRRFRWAATGSRTGRSTSCSRAIRRVSSGRLPTRTLSCSRSCPATSIRPTSMKHLPRATCFTRSSRTACGAGLISTVLGTQLPGPGTIYVEQSLHFRRPVGLGDTITVSVRVVSKAEQTHRVIFDCRATNQLGLDVITETAEVIAPIDKVSRPRIVLPDIYLRQKGRCYEQLIQRARPRADSDRRRPSGRSPVAARRHRIGPGRTHRSDPGRARITHPRHSGAGAHRSRAVRARSDGAQLGRGGACGLDGTRGHGRSAHERCAAHR
jgi:hypothetical protein